MDLFYLLTSKLWSLVLFFVISDIIFVILLPHIMLEMDCKWVVLKLQKTSQLHYRRSLEVIRQDGKWLGQIGYQVGEAMVYKKSQGIIKHIWFFADPVWQAWKILLILTDYVNIAPDPRKMLSYQQVGPSGKTTISRRINKLNWLLRHFISCAWQWNPLLSLHSQQCYRCLNNAKYVNFSIPFD